MKTPGSLLISCLSLCICLMTLPVFAPAQDSPLPPKAPGGQKLIIVVRVSNESKPINARRLQEIMEEGLEKSDCKCVGSPQVSTISPTFFREFQQVLQMAEGPPVEGGKNGSIRISPMFSEADEKFPYSYDITLNEKGSILSELQVFYDADGKSVESLKPDDRERVLQTGVDKDLFPVYRVRLPKPPVKYELKLEKLDSTEPTVVAEKWPMQDVHYAVAMQGFVGDFENLRRVLLNQGIDKMSDPLTDIASISDTRFVLGVIGGQLINTDSVELNQLLDIAEQEVPNRGVEKIFVKLPLNADEVRQELEKYSNFSNREAIQELRREAANVTPIGPAKTTRPLLKADAAAAWYELERAALGQPFRGQLTLGDPQNVAALSKRYPVMYMVVIQQNGNGDRARAVWVQVPENVGEVLPPGLAGQETLLIPRRNTDPDLAQAPPATEPPAPPK